MARKRHPAKKKALALSFRGIGASPFRDVPSPLKLLFFCWLNQRHFRHSLGDCLLMLCIFPLARTVATSRYRMYKTYRHVFCFALTEGRPPGQRTSLSHAASRQKKAEGCSAALPVTIPQDIRAGTLGAGAKRAEATKRDEGTDTARALPR